MKDNQSSPIALAAIIFGAAGFIFGVLFAPKSGRETRQDITNRTNDMKNKAANLKNKTTESMRELKNKTSNKIDSARNDTTESMPKLSSAQ